jgi:hypothetical protein
LWCAKLQCKIKIMILKDFFPSKETLNFGKKLGQWLWKETDLLFANNDNKQLWSMLGILMKKIRSRCIIHWFFFGLFYAPLQRSGAYCFAPVGQSVDQMISRTFHQITRPYLFFSLLRPKRHVRLMKPNYLSGKSKQNF